MEQLMPALDRLNQPWVEDPTAEGGDAYRIFLADSKQKLRKPSGPESNGISSRRTPAVKTQDQGLRHDKEKRDECPQILNESAPHQSNYTLGVEWT